MWVRVPDGASIGGGHIWDIPDSGLDGTDLAELELGLSSGDTVNDETSLGVIKKTEVLVGALDLDNI